MKAILLSCIVIILSFVAYGQNGSGHLHCSRVKQYTPATNEARPTVTDPRENDYDVQYVKLDLKMNNTSTNIAGSATTKARVANNSMSAYVFELIEDYTIDSLRFNGALLPVTTSGLVREVSLSQSLSVNTTFTVQVYYHGEPPFGPGFFTTGIRTETSPDWNAQVTYTLSEPYAARDWWPCKQSLQDKIDSSDVWITVANNLKAGSNGMLQQITSLPGNLSRYEWKSRNPIDYYLISAAVGPYVDYSYYMHFNASNDSMLVQNFVYDNPATLPFYKNAIDSTAVMINYFSDLLGRYPFWKEKYGHCIAPIGGGMEHQTMTTLNNFGTLLVAHELSHQWFGDNVTCGTWSDIWLNEGFATYLAHVYNGYVNGAAVASAEMDFIHNDVMTEPGGSVYCTDTTDVGRIFSGRLTYNKGAAIVNTLRFVFNDDALFFTMLKNYQQQYARHTATTEQFKSVAAIHFGQNLDTFFQQWIYGEGYPIYNAQWNQVNNQVIIRLEQTTSVPSSVSLFCTPVKIKLYAPDGDTLIRVYNNEAAQIFVSNWHKTIDSIAIDPDNDILNQVDSIRRDFSLLSINGFDTTLFLVYPNPTTDFWTLEGLPVRSDVMLTDISGRKLWRGSNGYNNAIKVNAQDLARGIYLLHIYKQGSADQTIKLLK